MLKALFINGSPRKQWNTAQLLQKALEGARDGGAETEMVNLYDRDMNYKGCMSCFACKVKFPSKSEIVPPVVCPTTRTVAPMMGSPCESFTWPFTVICAKAPTDRNRPNRRPSILSGI